MRVLRSFLLLLGVAIAVAGCTQQPTAYFAYPGAGMSGIDNVVYGGGAPYAPAMAGWLRGFALCAGNGCGLCAFALCAGDGQQATRLRPMAVSMATRRRCPDRPAYVLDSGDRLRIVVFGQDGLTNSYAVDASGNIDMPLIGAVSARG